MPENKDRFEPVKSKAGKSTTKRVAMFIFGAAGALFVLVAAAIINSDDAIQSSNVPSEIIKASRASPVLLPPPPQEPQPEPEPEDAGGQLQQAQQNQPEQPQVQQVQQPVVQPQQVAPAYIPAPAQVRRPAINRNFTTDRRRDAQTQRMQAASSPTAIDGFTRREEPNALNNVNNNNAVNAQGGINVGIDQQNGISVNAPGIGPSGLQPVDTLGLMQQQQANSMGGLGGLGGNNSNGAESTQDANGWMRKEAFLRQALPNAYSQHTRVFPVSAYELKAGSLLPCVLISGINSDMPGNLIAHVSENVWDTSTGHYLLIPRGSRLIGTYDHQISYGQNRVLVIWNRLIFPDGSSLLLDNLQGADQGGYAGFKARVDRHLGSLITSALMVSLLGAGVELASNNRNSNNNNSSRKNVGDILAERTTTAIAQALTQIITKNMNRQPTLTVRPGYRFTVFIQHDIVFPRIWSEAQGR